MGGWADVEEIRGRVRFVQKPEPRNAMTDWGFGVEGDLPAVGRVGEKDGESDGWDDDQGEVGLQVAWIDGDEWMDGGLLGEQGSERA